MIPKDNAARVRAIDPRLSVAVSAPAGSGKTGLLTQRVLNLLAICQHPEEIVCITFTKKAAGEMRHRITQALRHAATSERPIAEGYEQHLWDLADRALQQDRRCQWQLMENPQRLRIQTIDGYCRSLTLLNPLSSGFGGGSAILDNPSRVYQEAAEDTLSELETDSPIQPDLENLLLHLDNDRHRCVGLLTDLLASREQWLEPVLFSKQEDTRETLEFFLAELIEERLQQLAHTLGPYASDLCLLADYAATCLAESDPESPLCCLQGIAQLPNIEAEALPEWKALCDLLLTKNNGWRKTSGLNKNIGFPSDKKRPVLAERKAQMGELLLQLAETPGLLDQWVHVRQLPYHRYPETQWQLLHSLTNIMPKLAANLKLAFRKYNAVDFSEISQGALSCLGGPDNVSDLALQLDYQIRHILIDEFQDTSSIQWQMLEKLTEGWESGDGRTLFIVGDGMQSCYGFRNANVGLFLDARQHGINGLKLEPLDLCVNFRSSNSIVSWVNSAFSTAFPATDDIGSGAVSYLPSDSFDQSDLHSDAVTTHLLQNGECAEAEEAEKVVEITRQALAEDPQQSIAILVRDRGRLKHIMPALKRAGIAAVAADIDALSKRMAIQDLLSLTKALLDISDYNAWLAVLRAPWCGLDNSDLLTLATMRSEQQAETGVATPLPALLQAAIDSNSFSRAGQRALSRITPVINAALQARRRKPLRATVEGVWASLGGPAGLLTHNDLENCQTFFQVLEEHDYAGTIEHWVDFQGAIDTLFSRSQPPAGTRVEVMTIHKSKGLEFDTVIIPGLGQKPRNSDSPLFLWKEHLNQQHQKTLLLSPLAAVGDDPDPLYQYLKSQETYRQTLEATRLFYVGCTRAKSRLHLLATVDQNDDETFKPPASGSLLSMIWHSIKDEVEFITTPQEEQNAERGSGIEYPHVIRRLSESWRPIALAAPDLLTRFRGHEFNDDDNQASDEAWRQREQRHMGTVMHRALAQLARELSRAPTEEWIQGKAPFWRAQLQHLGLHGELLDRALLQIQQGIETTLNSETGRWVIDGNHQHSEVEVGYFDRRSNSESIVDRTFVFNEERWVIDYKSSSPSAGQPLDEFLDQETEHYQTQLQRYSRLFTNETVRTALYFPRLALLHEINAN